MTTKILIMGLPGSGKTTLARDLAPMLQAVHWNADSVRANINTHLGFSHQDRVEQARRMGWLCDQVVKSGHFAIADFVCPTKDTRDAFGSCFTIWVDTIKAGRFEDTNQIFDAPSKYDFRVTSQDSKYWSAAIYDDIQYKMDPTFIRAFMIGLNK